MWQDGNTALEAAKTSRLKIFFRIFLLLCLLGGLPLPLSGTTAWAEDIKLFGTVEFRSALDKVPDWLSVLSREKKSNFFETGKLWRGSYDEFKKKLAQADPKEQLRLVNRYWNQYPYREDRAVYKKEDYWAIPEQFAKNSGDCEDYSIAKYFTLRDAGYSPDVLRVVVLRDTIRNLSHAVLVVYLDNDAYVLDNLSNSVLSHQKYRNYLPQFSVNEKWRWIHVRPKK